MTNPDQETRAERREERRAKLAGAAMYPFFRLLRWIGAHVGGFYTAIGAYLVLGLLLILASIAGFAGMAELIDEGLTQRFDDAILLWLDTHATDGLTVVALEITSLGSGAPVYMVVGVASLFLWITRHRYSAALLWIAVLGANIVNAALKLSFGRPRPELFEWRTPYAGHSSFPSGHATTAMVVYATVAYLVVRLEKGRALRRFTMATAALVILLIGLSRLYLGVHYPSDVIAGYTLGFAWASFCVLGLEAVRYFRRRKPEVARSEADLQKPAVAGTETVAERPTE